MNLISDYTLANAMDFLRGIGYNYIIWIYWTIDVSNFNFLSKFLRFNIDYYIIIYIILVILNY